MFIYTNMKDKLKKLWQWLRKNVINKDMIVYFIIAELIFWSPCIVIAILAIIINPWFWTPFVLICAFWAGPFTPAIPLQIALAVAIKGIVEKVKKHRRQKDGNSNGEVGGDSETDRADRQGGEALGRGKGNNEEIYAKGDRRK